MHKFTISKLHDVDKSLDFKSVLPLVTKYLMVYLPIYISCYRHAECNPCSRHNSMFVGSVVKERSLHFGNNVCKTTIHDIDGYEPDDSDCFTFTEWNWYDRKKQRNIKKNR